MAWGLPAASQICATLTDTTPLDAIVAKVQKTISQQSSVPIVCQMSSSPYTAGDSPSRSLGAAGGGAGGSAATLSSCTVKPLAPFPSKGAPSAGTGAAAPALAVQDVSKTKDRPIT